MKHFPKGENSNLNQQNKMFYIEVNGNHGQMRNIYVNLVTRTVDTLLNWRIHFLRNWRKAFSKIWIIHCFANTQNWVREIQAWSWSYF